MEEYYEILGRLDERSKSIKEDVHSILGQLNKLNGKVATHENEIHQIKLKLAVSHGHWGAVNKLVIIGITLLGIVVGAWATMLWH
jgi:hypothetical protein